MLAPDLTFTQAVAAIGGHGIVRGVRARYREPWRAYHDELHLSELEGHLRTAEQEGAPLVDGAAAFGFVLWHDAVYDPQSAPGRNETLSARLCSAEFSAIAHPVSVRRACQAILATIGHQAPDRGESPDAALLLDCDLGVLAAGPERFAGYDAAIRVEYGHVPEAVYAAKRPEVLAGFLRRDRIYRTEWAWRRWEARARTNLAASLGKLA